MPYAECLYEASSGRNGFMTTYTLIVGLQSPCLQEWRIRENEAILMRLLREHKLNGFIVTRGVYCFHEREEPTLIVLLPIIEEGSKDSGLHALMALGKQYRQESGTSEVILIADRQRAQII